MTNQSSNKYLLNRFMVYLDNDNKVGMLLDLFEMLSNKYLLKINGLPGFVGPYGGYDWSVKYLLNTFMVYLDSYSDALLVIT